MKRAYLLFFLSIFAYCAFSQNNLARKGRISSSTEQAPQPAKFAIDGDLTTYWSAEDVEAEKWVLLVLPEIVKIKAIKINMTDLQQQPITSFAVQTYINGRWENREEQSNNKDTEISIEWAVPVLNDRLRLIVTSNQSVQLKEIEVYGDKYIAEDATRVKPILINQSGYNLGKPKRFTAPHTSDGAAFIVHNTRTREVVYEGIVEGHIGDFSAFNPLGSDEFSITIDTASSYPFRVGPYWLERVSYQNMIDFMIGARHYVGTTDQIRNHSWEWRDGDFFHWSLQGLVAQYLSNPEAYLRLEKKVKYIKNEAFPSDYKGKWGSLEPYDESAPDIVKLMHWDVDVKISQGLEHEHQKAELAHFLYAYPFLKAWLPKQNFDVVYQYLKSKWTKAEVVKASTSRYDQSPEHNLLALKTKLGTFKGELPPGHSIIPNLMMYEVAKRQGEVDADKYFNAAFAQMEWMITHLDWKDPMTTKGQRMSEHLTMRAFAYFYHQYPERRPPGLYEKIEEWARIAVSRSHNIWDFRKFTDEGDWVPAGWNETGNILGFPAAALAAKSVIKDNQLKKDLDRLVWSHFDNAFGRNPTGRHFSYDGPKEIEGVDLGWYSAHHGGIGLLEPVRFVFDGSPKTNHYPNNPEIGNYGWTEGWVQFNTAFNTSMAYLAHDETEIELIQRDPQTLTVRLKAPLNFDEQKVDKVQIILTHSNGDTLEVTLTEEGKFSKYLSGTVPLKEWKRKKGDSIRTSYGLGYFERTAAIMFE